MNSGPSEYRIPGFSVPVVGIDEASRDAYVDNGYNPPSAVAEDPAGSIMKQHYSEWHEVFGRVKSAISTRWMYGIDDGDFFMDSDPEPTRLMCIEVSNEAMLNADVIQSVHKIVVDYPIPYSVDICDSWVFLKTKEGKAYPHFNIFVEKERILVFTESDALFQRLGAVARPPN